MYINTTLQIMMVKSICEALNICKDDLNDLLDICYIEFQKERSVIILDDQYDYFMDYVKKHLCINIDYVNFYHLSRRLNDNKDDN